MTLNANLGMESPFNNRKSYMTGIAGTLKQPQDDIQKYDRFEDLLTSKIGYRGDKKKSKIKLGSKKASIDGAQYIHKPNTS